MSLDQINQALAPFIALVSLGVGFTVLGVDLLKVFHLNALRRLLKYVAGFAGACALVQLVAARVCGC